MATGGQGYPKMPAKAWSSLRARAAAAPSVKLNPANVAALLGMASPTSARDNVVTHLRRMGLIDDDGALTPRGNKWRIDASYPDACQEILEELYPDDLNILTDSDGSPDVQKVKTWFDHQGFGDSNARQMAATYVMVASKRIPDPAMESTKPSVPRATAKPAKKEAAEKTTATTTKGRVREATSDSGAASEVTQGSPTGPNVHLDIQIHIPGDATADQIDQIFASMARHLYGR